MDLSIIVPVYNVARYLRQCLDSILAQTVPDMEVICVDDGSTDGSGMILDEYSNKDGRVHVIHKENAGYGAAMNVGLKKSGGNYIGIVESDDFVEPDMFEQLLFLAKNSDADVIRTNYFEFRSDGGDICRNILELELEEGYAVPPYGKIIRAAAYPDCFRAGTYPWAGIYKRKFLLNEDIWFNETPGASFQDVSFAYKILASSPKIMFTPCAWYHYRFDNEDASVKSKGKVFCICDEFEEVWRYLEKDQDKHTRVKYYIALAQFIRYEGTLFRLEQPQRLKFLRRMCSDFAHLRHKGLLHRAYWGKADWSRCNELLTRYSNEYRQYYDELLKQQDREIFLSCFYGEKANYLFGAGKIAAEVLENTMEVYDKISGIVVSDKNTNPDKLMGFPVFDMTDKWIDKKNARVFLCVKEEDQVELADFLKASGYIDMVFVSKDIRRMLRG